MSDYTSKKKIDALTSVSIIHLKIDLLLLLYLINTPIKYTSERNHQRRNGVHRSCLFTSASYQTNPLRRHVLGGGNPRVNCKL